MSEVCEMKEEPGLSIGELCRRAHETAEDNGFHEAVGDYWLDFPTFAMQIVEWLSGAVEADRISELEDRDRCIGRAIEAMGGYVAGDWQRIPDRFATFSVLVVAEMAEACVGRADAEKSAEELAGAMIRIADLAAVEGIDLEAAIKAKLEKNAAGLYRDGGKKY